MATKELSSFEDNGSFEGDGGHPHQDISPLKMPSSDQLVNNHLEKQNSVSSPTPMSPDPVHDLPEDLLRAGWRKFWSKREGRPYFFNKITNESLWDMPQAGVGVSIKASSCEHKS